MQRERCGRLKRAGATARGRADPGRRSRRAVRSGPAQPPAISPGDRRHPAGALTETPSVSCPPSRSLLRQWDPPDRSPSTSRRLPPAAAGRLDRRRPGRRHRPRPGPGGRRRRRRRRRPATSLTALPDGAKVAIITADTDAGRHILRHSTAHVLAQAVTDLWPGAHYAIGPPIEDGFYYDFELPGGQPFSATTT